MGKISLSLLFLFCSTEGGLQQFFSQEFAPAQEKFLGKSPYNRAHHDQSSRSEVSLTYEKRGFLGKISFDVDVMLPLHSKYRNITHIDVKFDPMSDLGGEVYVTRGGRGLDFATIHFQSEADGGSIRAFITLDSK